MSPILLTHQEYYATAFLFVQFGLFYTGKILFAFPDEVAV